MPDVASVHIGGAIGKKRAPKKAPRGYSASSVGSWLTRSKTGTTPGGRKYGSIVMLNSKTGERRQNTKVVSSAQDDKGFTISKEYGKTTRGGSTQKVAVVQRGSNVTLQHAGGPKTASNNKPKAVRR